MKLHNEKIDELRKQHGLSRNQLARLINVQPGSLANVMAGRRKPGRKLLAGLLRLFPAETVSSLTVKEGR